MKSAKKLFHYGEHGGHGEKQSAFDFLRVPRVLRGENDFPD